MLMLRIALRFVTGKVSVAFKAMDGSIDRAGIVWRYQNPNNYYIVRANGLENNVVLYKVAAGTRVSIARKGLPSRSYGETDGLSEFPAPLLLTTRTALREAIPSLDRGACRDWLID